MCKLYTPAMSFCQSRVDLFCILVVGLVSTVYFQMILFEIPIHVLAPVFIDWLSMMDVLISIDNAVTNHSWREIFLKIISFAGCVFEGCEIDSSSNDDNFHHHERQYLMWLLKKKVSVRHFTFTNCSQSQLIYLFYFHKRDDCPFNRLISVCFRSHGDSSANDISVLVLRIMSQYFPNLQRFSGCSEYNHISVIS